MRNIALFLLIVLPVFAGSIWLQCFLSRRKNKWLGLIIPLICFMFSLMAVFSLAMFTSMESASVTEISEGIIVSEKIVSSSSEKPSIAAMIFMALPTFLITNIPTLIFLAVYFACREKLKLQTELDKMNIQDLE